MHVCGDYLGNYRLSCNYLQPMCSHHEEGGLQGTQGHTLPCNDVLYLVLLLCLADAMALALASCTAKPEQA